MNKEHFNQLDIEQQRIYINSFLSDGISLTKACEKIGIDRATVRKRFKSKGIIFYKNANRYIYDNSPKSDTTKTTETTIENKIKSPKKIGTDLDNIKLLEEKIKTLESQIEATNKRIDSLITTNTTNTTDSSIRTFKGEEVVRSFRLNKDIQERFKRYCKTSDYKVSDILNTILEDFLNSKGAK